MGYLFFADVDTLSTIPLAATLKIDDDTTSTASQLTLMSSAKPSAAGSAQQVATSLDVHLPTNSNKNSKRKCTPTLTSSLIAGKDDIVNYAREEHIAKLELLKFQRECFEAEHSARMEIYNLQKSVLRSKLHDQDAPPETQTEAINLMMPHLTCYTEM